MTTEMVIGIAQYALVTFLKVAGPMLAAGMIIGILISLFQSMTQINEMTLVFVPKILVVLTTTVFFLPWIIRVFMQFTYELLFIIPANIRM